MTDTLTRRAQAPAAVRTWNEEARTVECVWSVGADVRRRDWRNGGDYIERLSMAPGAIDLGRLNSGASLLDSHSAYSMHDRVGIVVPGSARVENGKGIATLQLLRTTLGEALAEACRSGAGFLISVGYRITEATRTEGDDESLPVITATRWEPMELSAVAIGADPAARTRGMEMDYETEAQAAVEGRETPATRTAPPARQSAPGAEATRISAIRGLGTRSAIPADTIATAIDEGTSIDAFRKIVLDTLIERSAVAEGTGLSQVFEPQGRRGGTETAAASEALFARGNPGHRLSERARPYAHFSLLDHARAAIGRMGERTDGMSPSQIFARSFHTTSDFPILLAGAAQQSLRAGYAAPEAVILEAVRRVSHRDFRVQNHVDMSALPKLLKINEHGEYRRGTVDESSEGFAIATFGRMIGVTRQLLINDNLGAFVELPARYGIQARNLEIDLVVTMLTANPTLSDNVPVFHESRGNLIDMPLSVAGLSAARLAMRKQRDRGGELIAISPKFLIVSPELETNAEQLLAAISATEVGSANPFAGKLQLLVEPRLEGTAWYLAAAPGLVDGLALANLEGEEQPVIEVKEGWDVDGMEMKCRLDAGAGWIDHRGWIKSTGQPE